MLLAEASSAICVQRFDDSRNSAIHTTYRISLRSSSMREPRYPLLRVVFVMCSLRADKPASVECLRMLLRLLQADPSQPVDRRLKARRGRHWYWTRPAGHAPPGASP